MAESTKAPTLVRMAPAHPFTGAHQRISGPWTPPAVGSLWAGDKPEFVVYANNGAALGGLSRAMGVNLHDGKRIAAEESATVPPTLLRAGCERHADASEGVDACTRRSRQNAAATSRRNTVTEPWELTVNNPLRTSSRFVLGHEEGVNAIRRLRWVASAVRRSRPVGLAQRAGTSAPERDDSPRWRATWAIRGLGGLRGATVNYCRAGGVPVHGVCAAPQRRQGRQERCHIGLQHEQRR